MHSPSDFNDCCTYLGGNCYENVRSEIMRRSKIEFSQVSVIPRTAETFKPTLGVGFFFAEAKY
jgi:hypothetical protein